MRFIFPAIALFLATVRAQQNAINVPAAGLSIVANKPITITWTNPSSGTITIKLQQGSEVTPQSGLVVASGIEASAGTATFEIPGNQVDTAQYNFEMIDDTDPSNYNFSPAFSITGANGQGDATLHSSFTTAEKTGSTSMPLLSTHSKTSSMPSITKMSSVTTSLPTASPQTTIVDSNGASSLGVQGSLIAFVLGAIAIL